MKKRWISLLLAFALMVSLIPAIGLQADALWIEYDERAEVDGSYYTTSSKMAAKLNQIFDGNANIYHDRGCTNAVNVRIGTSNVKNNGVIMYAGPYGGSYVNSGTSCWIYAAGVYYTLFGNIGLTNPTSKSERLDLSTGSGTITSYANFKAWGVRDGVGAHIRTTSHSMIVLDYDEDTITIVDGNNDGNGKVSVRKRSWDKFNYYVNYIVQPTDEYYYSEYPVYDCDHEYTQTITSPAKCVEDGVITYSCTKCPDSYTQSIPATGHNFQNDYCLACGAYDSSILKGTCGVDLNWTLRSGKLTVEGSGDMYDYGYSGAPWFKNRTTIKEVVIDDGITHIGDHAFAFSENLSSVTIGDSVTAIGDFAFQSCARIQTLTLGSSVQTIGLEAFKYTSIRELDIPDSTTHIGQMAFGFCEALKNVRIGRGITLIDDYAFYYDTSLQTIHFAGSAPTFGDNIFGEEDDPYGLVEATAYYPTNDSSWNSSTRGNYGGSLTWVSYYQGLNQVDGQWGYYDQGVFQPSFTGLTQYDGQWYYVENGCPNWYYTGLVSFNNTWFYVENGIVNWNYTGLTVYGGYWFYVENGQVNWDYVGLTQFGGYWFYVENGQVNWNYTGLTCFNGWWFYVEQGQVDWNYVGLTLYNGYWFYVENGQVNWEYNSLTQFGGYWFCVSGGMVNWDYVGLVYYNGALFYVANGMVDWTYNGTIIHDGVEYTIVGGIAQ